MEFIKNKLIALLGLKNLYAEMQELRDNLEYLESQYEDTKYLAENLELQVSELESKADDFEYATDNIRTDLESDFRGLQEEVNEVLTDFETMTEGYTVSVKLNPPL